MAIVNLNEISNFLKKFKFGLYGVSFILFALGLFIFYSSYEALHNPLIQLTSVDKTFIYICFLLSIILILVSYLGSSEKFENLSYVKAFFGLILICLVLQIFVAFQITKINSDEVATEINKNCITKYHILSQENKKSVDTMQSENRCCGIESYTDYGYGISSLPKSCCESNEETYCTAITVFRKGCRISIEEIVFTKKSLYFGIFILTSVIQILTIALPIIFSKDTSEQSSA